MRERIQKLSDRGEFILVTTICFGYVIAASVSFLLLRVKTCGDVVIAGFPWDRHRDGNTSRGRRHPPPTKLASSTFDTATFVVRSSCRPPVIRGICSSLLVHSVHGGLGFPSRSKRRSVADRSNSLTARHACFHRHQLNLRGVRRRWLRHHCALHSQWRGV